MGPKAREPEDLAVAVPHREHDARAEEGVRPASDRSGRESGGHDLLLRVPESPEVGHHHFRPDRGVADPEVADHPLLQAVLRKHAAGRLGGFGLPEICLEEVGGVGKQLPNALLRSCGGLRFLRRGDDIVIVPDQQLSGGRLPSPTSRLTCASCRSTAALDEKQWRFAWKAVLEREILHAMSEQNVEFVKGLYGAAEALDKQQLLEALPALIEQSCDPEIEWFEDPQRADSRIYRGHEG